MTARRLITWSRILLGLYLMAVFFLCFGKFDSASSVDLSFLGIPTDKLVHFAMFLPYPFLVYFSLRNGEMRRADRAIAIGWVFLSGVVIAAATEAAQYFIPYRTGEWRDLFADSAALAVSSLILLVLCLRKD